MGSTYYMHFNTDSVGVKSEELNVLLNPLIEFYYVLLESIAEIFINIKGRIPSSTSKLSRAIILGN